MLLYTPGCSDNGLRVVNRLTQYDTACIAFMYFLGLRLRGRGDKWLEHTTSLSKADQHV